LSAGTAAELRQLSVGEAGDVRIVDAGAVAGGLSFGDPRQGRLLFLLSGLLKIDSALTPVSFVGRDRSGMFLCELYIT